MVPINNKTLILPLRYKTLKDQIDKIIPAIKDMERIREESGPDVKFQQNLLFLCKIYRQMLYNITRNSLIAWE